MRCNSPHAIRSNSSLTVSSPFGSTRCRREDGSSLFGFPCRQERDLFRLLIGVNGVGPQAGLALLHECKPQELVAAISGGDLKRLCQAQGIGKRTAERLAVDLRTPIAAFGGLDPQPSLVEGLASDRDPRSGGRRGSQRSISLGYDELEIRQSHPSHCRWSQWCAAIRRRSRRVAAGVPAVAEQGNPLNWRLPRRKGGHQSVGCFFALTGPPPAHVA